MGYGSYYNTGGVTMRDSFAAYVEKFKNTKPINSKQSKGAVPLGDRKKHNMASISMPDENTVHLNFYGHPLVIWKPDDTLEIRPPRHYSAYVVDNIQQFAPVGIHFTWNRGRIVVLHGDKSYLLEDGKDKSLKFKRVSPETYELIDVPVEYAIRKKRGMEKKYLKDCEPFLDWVDLVKSIDNTPTDPVADIKVAMDVLYKELGLMSADEFERWSESWAKKAELERPDRWAISRYREHLPHGGKGQWRGYDKGFHTKGCEILMNWITSPMNDNWATALYVLTKNQGTRQSFRQNGDFNVTIKLTRADTVEYLKEIILHVHFDECFVREPLGAGEIPTKQNSEYTNLFGEIL
jgi:hypothetical protein